MYDEQILGLFFARSEQALQETQKKYGSYARRIVENILPSREDGEECLNDVYLTLWSRIPPEQPASLKAYLGTLARNAAISRYRAAHAEKRGGGLPHLGMCGGGRPEFEEVPPLPEIHGHDDFGFQTVR